MSFLFNEAILKSLLKKHTGHGDLYLPYYHTLTYFRITLYTVHIKWLRRHFTVFCRSFPDAK